MSDTLSRSMDTPGSRAGNGDDSGTKCALISLTRKSATPVEISEDVEKDMKTAALNMDAELKAPSAELRRYCVLVR